MVNSILNSYLLVCTVTLLAAAMPVNTQAQGGQRIEYQGSPKNHKYEVTLTAKGAFSERSTTWYLNVHDHQGAAVVSNLVFRPFYAWTCVMRGQAKWVSDSALLFSNLPAQGRQIDVHLKNKTARTLPYTELWMRSIDRQGYPHAPCIGLLFNLEKDQRAKFLPEIFPGAEYFMIACESEGKTVTACYKVPARKGWPHDIDLDDPKKRLVITLTADGPTIDGGAFQSLSETEKKALVPEGRRLHLSEKRWAPFKTVNP